MVTNKVGVGFFSHVNLKNCKWLPQIKRTEFWTKDKIKIVNIYEAKIIYKMENILMFQPRKEQMFTLLNVLIFVWGLRKCFTLVSVSCACTAGVGVEFYQWKLGSAGWWCLLGLPFFYQLLSTYSNNYWKERWNQL